MRGSMLAVLTLALLPPPAAAGSGLLLTVGDVTPTAAVVWVRAPAAADVAVEVTADELPVVATARMSVFSSETMSGRPRRRACNWPVPTSTA